MNVIVPNKFNTITTSTLTEPLSHSEWDEATTYALDDLVHITYYTTDSNASDNDFVLVYKSMKADNLGLNPKTNPLYWQEIAPTNETAFLDRYMDSQTVSDDGSELQVSFTSGINDCVVALNVSAKFCVLQVGKNATDDYDYTYIYNLLEDTSIWSEASFEDIRYQKEALFQIPLNNDVECRITLTNADLTNATTQSEFNARSGHTGNVGLGKLIAGRVRAIGKTLYGATVNLMSISEKVRDTTGYTYLKKKKTFKDSSYEVIIDKSTRDIVYRLMESLDAVPCVFVPVFGSDVSANSYGYFTDFSLIIDNPTTSTYNLTVEGLA